MMKVTEKRNIFLPLIYEGFFSRENMGTEGFNWVQSKNKECLSNSVSYEKSSVLIYEGFFSLFTKVSIQKWSIWNM